jgi:DNA-binding IclR family transcriptional regulator
MRHGAKDDQPISVLGRVCAILDAFGPDDTVLPLPALRARTGLPKATVHRLAHELAGHGLLEATPHGFRLGPWLHAMGTRADPQARLRETAMPHLVDLYEATRLTVQLGVLTGDAVTVVSALAGHGASTVPVAAGVQLPLSGSALGAALVAHAGPTVRAALLDGGSLDGDLARLQATVRDRGVAVDYDDVAGLACVAAPVLGADGTAVAALGVVGPVDQVDVAAVTAAVRAAADALGHDLTAPVANGDRAVALASAR